MFELFRKFEFKTACLNAKLDEEVFIKQAERFEHFNLPPEEKS